jgi:putative acetyltransferase
MITVRPEAAGDETSVREVNVAAFPGPAEADLVDKLRSAQVITLSLVAVSNDRIVGHALFSPVNIESGGAGLAGLGLGPVAVLPDFQRRDIGSSLIKAGIAQLRRDGQTFVVVLGHPDYYPRFGFRPTAEFGIRCEWDVPPEAFMVMELCEGALAGHKGVVKYRPEFDEV